VKIVETDLPGVLLLELDVFRDHRGLFLEIFNRGRYAGTQVASEFVQDNLSRSKQGVLRGLHFQHPHGQGKLIQVLRGRIFDVAVDVRRGSPAFGRWVGVELSDERPTQIWIPPGFAHGFCALEDSDVLYKCTETYVPSCERGIRWNDPALAVRWPISDPALSPKDARAPLLAEAPELPSVEGTDANPP
jgi:dTDP-4-dehydrorhamnose 3,5-epimerase